MASYQIPQFLDSGDKILGPLNVRQFAYALGGGFLSIMTFTVIQSIAPAVGNYAFIPVIPILAITAYLALGKYNGRDTEVYVLKMILYFIKPRAMKFAKVPDVADLNEELSKYTYNNILNEWNKRLAKSKEAQDNILSAFRTKSSEEKAERIRNLGIRVDRNIRNSLEETFELQEKRDQTQSQIDKILNKPATNQNYSPSPLINETPNQSGERQGQGYKEVNFFGSSPKSSPTLSKLDQLKKKYGTS